ncbi:hypothetical protein AC1031_012233 [Aphanomyces cochlioides]|nr:hypothetical protein AC1031_012233 [Aphanomyces cochlioides]
MSTGQIASLVETDVCAQQDVSDVDKEKPAKRRKASKQPRSIWSDESVHRLFELRFKSHISQRFMSKNNSGKRVAYVMLAAELSVDMQSEFTPKQAQDKLAKMKVEWSVSNPSLAQPTGHSARPPQPQHFDIMMEFWGSKVGYQRESLLTTDDDE